MAAFFGDACSLKKEDVEDTTQEDVEGTFQEDGQLWH